MGGFGARVGILDADITGPNIPTMLGIDQGLLAEGAGGLHTVEAYGVVAASIGFVLPQGTPVVWRGPMIGSGVRQLLHDVEWGELDYLIVDLPPGTSDASMSMAQEAAIAGVVVVSTPQRVAIEDATKAVGMFDRLGVPIFGIVENMASDVFGRGGARTAAEELGVEFLSEAPPRCRHPRVRRRRHADRRDRPRFDGGAGVPAARRAGGGTLLRAAICW